MDKIAPTPQSNPALDSIVADLKSQPDRARRRFLRLQGYPRFLYKYRVLDLKKPESISRFRDLVIESRFWLSSPDEFNDPFDMSVRMVIEGSKVKWFARLRKMVDQRESDKPLEYRKRLLAKLYELPIEHHLANAKAALAKNRLEIGVYAFAGDPRSIVMWSHYGIDHEGVCFQFDVARDLSTFLLAVRVDYTEHYPTINWMKETQAQVRETLLRKHVSWDYERERRIVIPGGAHCFRPFQPGALTGIIFGCRATDSVKEKVRETLDERSKLGLPRVNTYVATKHDEKYELVVRRA